MLSIMLQFWNIRNELNDNFEGTLNEVAAAGYQYVELAYAQAYGKPASDLKASLDKAGLKAPSAHATLKELSTNTGACLDFHVEMGCKYIVIPFLGPEDRSSGPNYENVKKEIAKIGEAANKAGLILLYHNHEFEFETYNGKYALDDLYDSVPANLLQTQIDVCWAKVGGVDPVQYILKYKGRAPVVHLKDFDLSQGGTVKADYDLLGEAKKARAAGAFPFCAVGYGCQDIPAVIKASVEAGAEWVVVEQDLPTPGKTPMECAKDSLDYLKGIIK